MRIKLSDTSIFYGELRSIARSLSKYIVEKLKEVKEQGIFLKTFLNRTERSSEYLLYSVSRDEFPEQFEILREYDRIEVSCTSITFRTQNERIYADKNDIFYVLLVERFNLRSNNEKLVELEEFVKDTEDFVNRLIKFLIDLDKFIEQSRVKLCERFKKTEIFEYLKKREFEEKLEV